MHFDNAIYEDDHPLEYELCDSYARVSIRESTCLRVGFNNKRSFVKRDMLSDRISMDSDIADELELIRDRGEMKRYTEQEVGMLVGRVFTAKCKIDEGMTSRLYPFLYKSNRDLVRDIGFITYVVGMHIPGHHSVLGSISYEVDTGNQNLYSSCSTEYYVKLKKFRSRASYGIRVLLRFGRKVC